jgi:hypothetical protein
VKQKITGYHLDNENHWVAELSCGHNQHVRHDPPWSVREWVTTTEGRESRLGVELNCVRCDEAGRAIATAIIREVKLQFLASYEDAGISGLCEEGRIEAALGSLDSLPFDSIIEGALKQT